MNSTKKIQPCSKLSTILSAHGYDYIRPLGHGGFATVHLVSSQKYQKQFAAKVCEDDFHSSAASATMEIKNLMNLCHPNIILIYDYFIEDHFQFMILEYCPYGSIADEIREKGTIPDNELYCYFRQITNALLTCHKANIVHRDIKPANVLLDHYHRPKLADFGLSFLVQPGQKENVFGGSRPYMAPEVLSHKSCDLIAADIWSLGILFYTMKAGHIPWSSLEPNDLKDSILSGIIEFPTNFPLELSTLIRRMCRKDPSKRISLEKVLSSNIFQPTIIQHYSQPFISYKNQKSDISNQNISFPPLKRIPSGISTTFLDKNNNEKNEHFPPLIMNQNPNVILKTVPSTVLNNTSYSPSSCKPTQKRAHFCLQTFNKIVSSSVEQKTFHV